MVEGKAAGTFFRWRTARSELRLAAALLFWLALLVFGAAPARAASFTALLDRDTITLGEQATLSLKFDGVQPQNAPALPAVAGLQFQYVGPSSSFSFINGQTSSSITYNYIVAAQRDGEFTIPAMKSDVNGQQLSSLPIKLAVLKANAPSAAVINSGGEVAFLKLVLPKQQVHTGEVLASQLLLCLRDDVQNFGNFRLTSTPAEGFSIGKLAEAPHRQQQVGNRVYTIIPISFALTATKAGSLSSGRSPRTSSWFCPRRTRAATRSSGSFSIRAIRNRFRSRPSKSRSSRCRCQRKTSRRISTARSAITPWPSPPGRRTSPSAIPSPCAWKLPGAARSNAIKLPDQSNWSGFKLFAPSSKVETSDQLGVEGTKTFEEIVTPQNADVRELPPLAFSFFNPDDGKYHTLTQPAMPLAVRSAASTPMPAMAANQNSAPQNEPQQDILPIKQNLGTLASSNAPLITKPAFLAAQSLPVLAFLAAFVWRKRADSLAHNPRLRRQRAVAQLVASGMDDLKKYAAANQPDEFFATLFRLLQEQLGERLDCPASAITENVIEEHTVLRGAPKATLDALRDQFQLCNQARYARVRGSSELNSVAAQFEKLIGQLREVKA